MTPKPKNEDKATERFIAQPEEIRIVSVPKSVAKRE